MPYGEGDAAFFFGRERERRIISANLKTSRLTLVYGASGVGKSSVLHAGVAHSLHEEAHEQVAEGRSPRFLVVTFGSWQDDPAAALADRVAEVLDVSARSGSFVDVLEGWGERRETEVLVILDQFEECLDLLNRRRGDDRFAEEFVHALDSPTLRAHFLISIREDALARLDRFKGQIPGLFANYLRLDNLSPEAARAAIEGPLAVYSERLAAAGDGRVEIEEALVDAVIEQVRTGRITVGQGGRGGLDDGEVSMRIETPYLQLVMTRIWEEERREGSHLLRLSTLDRLGGAEEIVRAHLDEQMSALSAPEQEIAARVFDRLVTPSGTKLAQRIDDLVPYSGVDRASLESVLEKLSGRGRILHPLPAPSSEPGATRYEIFHDRLAGAVLEWRRRYLEQVERERQVEAERLRTRRLRRLVLVLGGVVALIGGVAAAMVWLWVNAEEQKRQATAAGAAAFAANAQSELQANPKLAVQTALRGYEKQHTADTLDALRTALLASHERRRLALAGGPAGVSPDGLSALVITGRGRFEVQRFDGTSEKLDATGTGGALSPDGRSAVTIDGNGRARLWTLDDRSSSHLRTAADVEKASFSPDGKFVVTAEPGRAGIWNAKTGKAVEDPFEYQLITDAAVNRGANVVVAGSQDGSVLIWQDGPRKPPKRRRTAHVVTAVAISPNGRFVAAATAGGALVWDLPAKTRTPVTCGRGTSNAVSFSRDGRLLVSGQNDGTAEICDPVLGLTLVELRGHHGAITSVSSDATSRRVLTAAEDGTARIWTVGLIRFPNKLAQGAAFDSTGRRVVTTGLEKVRIWDATSGHELAAIPTSTALTDATLEPGGDRVATAEYRRARLWKVGAEGPISPRLFRDGEIKSIVFDPQGKRVLVAAGSNAVIVDAEKPDRRSLLPASAGLFSASFSHDGRLVAAGSDNGAVVWRLDPRLKKRLGHDEVRDAEFSRDGNLVVTAGRKGAVVWKWATRRRLATLPDLASVRSAAFSPDGNLVVAGNDDGLAQLWDWRNRIPLAVLSRAGGPAVVSARFSPDGTKILLALGAAGAVMYDCRGCGSPSDLKGEAAAPVAEEEG